ncbi:MAG: efflux RND transporter permease subunit [Deltaproteobacteria bacterium]|nr:efflux RND transporter permease subunit [Deltaproteobacteria bacterium]
MIERVIELSAKRPGLVFGATACLVVWAIVVMQQTPLDAIPDLSDPQVIVFTDWMGRSPDLVEDQVTYPLVRALQSTPKAKTVRGYSMFGMSFIYVIFDDDTDIYWARTRVLEQLGRVQQILPPDVSPVLGPDASGVGWVFQYALEDTSGGLDLAQLRELQDFTIRPTLQAVAGVAEIASFGGFERQYQIVLDPNRLAAWGLSLADVTRAARDANSEVGARVLELAGREYVLRGRGYVKSLADLEASVVSVGAGGTPIRLGDVARVQFGPEIRRGAADWDGRGEAVGGIVVMRLGANALEVNDAVKAEIARLSLPEGVRLVTTYDRSELIEGAVETLTGTLLQQGVIVALICLVFLFSIRSAFVAIIVIPIAVIMSFIPMHYLGMTINIMSLAGIAIAVGELEDASTTFVENGARKLSLGSGETDRRQVILDALKEVGRPTFFSLLLVTVSFVPLLTLTGQAGRLFRPLVLTHTFATFAAALLAVTLVPALMLLVMRGRFRTEEQNPVSRVLTRLYRPVVGFAVRARWLVLGGAAVLLLATVPVALRLGSEFMPPLNEGSLLVMPTTFPGIAIEEARRALTAQHRIIMGFGEVASVHGKAGRAETATDPAQLDMNESVVVLKPTSEWPMIFTPRWYSDGAPGWLKPALRPLWPEERARTLEELGRDLDVALRMPGYQMAIAPPIRTRIDMLTTGVRTPVGIKVFGDDLAEIERVSVALEGMLRAVPGTRSTFAERQTGREYIDVIPDREAIARYGLSVRDVHDVIEAAVGGMQVSTVISGRSRFSINVRYAADFRADPEALRGILVPVSSSEPVAEAELGSSGVGASGTSMGGSSSSSTGGAGGMGGMGGGSAGRPAPMTSSRTVSTTPGMATAVAPDASERFRPTGATVPLGALAEVRVVTGPPMIKDENGILVGYVFADIDSSKRDLGGWVADAKALVAKQLSLPAGYRLQWTGQYEFMEEMQARMAWVVPLTLLLVVFLLRRAMRGWAQTGLVLTSLPFALTGSVWLLFAQGYNVSTAVWVGLIAVIGTASETGILMVEFLDQAVLRRQGSNATLTLDDVNEAVVDGASSRVRPLVMSVASTVLGLLPLLWEAGPGADVSARIAAPVVGGLISCLVLTLLVLPAAYTVWRRRQVPRAVLAGEAGVALDAPTASPPTVVAAPTPPPTTAATLALDEPTATAGPPKTAAD